MEDRIRKDWLVTDEVADTIKKKFLGRVKSALGEELLQNHRVSDGLNYLSTHVDNIFAADVKYGIIDKSSYKNIINGIISTARQYADDDTIDLGHVWWDGYCCDNDAWIPDAWDEYLDDEEVIDD